MVVRLYFSFLLIQGVGTVVLDPIILFPKFRLFREVRQMCDSSFSL